MGSNTTGSQVLTDVQGAIDLVNLELPGLAAAYEALRLIWTAFDPTMTEEQYKARLRQAGVDGGAVTSAYLVAHGYTQVTAPDGTVSWTKPAPPAAAPPAAPAA